MGLLAERTSGYQRCVDVGFFVASGVSLVCLAILFVAGNRLARAAVAAFVVVIVVGYVVLAAVASGWMTYLVERFL